MKVVISKYFAVHFLLLALTLFFSTPACSANRGFSSQYSSKTMSKEQLVNIPSMYLKAVTNSDPDALKKLIAKWPKQATGAHFKARPLLRVAIKGGNSKIVKILLENNKSDIDLKDRNGFTPLMAAAVWKKYEIVKLLLDHGADPNIKDNMGNTAIFRAIFTHNNDILRLLMTRGADVTIPNATGMTPLKMVEGTEQGAIMKELLEKEK